MSFRLSNFDEFCAGAKCTPEEREKLAMHLAQFRMIRTYEALKCPSTPLAHAVSRKVRRKNISAPIAPSAAQDQRP